jgi:uncharacterized protein (TIGR02145 family)
MTDQEGNVYKTIAIGNQEWMAENLNTSIYRNGDPIQSSSNNFEWPSGAWVYYNNDSNYACPYGKLYNWYACVDPRGLCPVGWHVPSVEEWFLLTDFVGYVGAGDKMKSGADLWSSPSLATTNSSGFSGLPGGYKDGGYYQMGGMGLWWSSNSGFDPERPAVCVLESFSEQVLIESDDFGWKSNGYSIRCLRD